MTCAGTTFRDSTHPVVAGPLRAEFDIETGALEYVFFQQFCVWRQLVVLVRDDQWHKVPAKVQLESFERGDEDFSIRFRSYHDAGEQRLFSWTGELQGSAGGEITYAFSGEALTRFSANRIGFSLLHPSWICSGQSLRQTRTDGSIVEGEFPELIEPQVVGKYSIKDLGKLAHQFAPGQWAEAEFEGEVFETEDQRNWADASFKTYCTPLAQPFPVTLNPGDTRAQKVMLRLLEDSATTTPRNPGRVGSVSNAHSCRISLPGLESAKSTFRPTPELGLMVAERESDLTTSGQKALGRLGLDCLRIDLPVADPSWMQRLQGALEQARTTNVPLEIVLQLPQSARVDLSNVAAALSVSRDDIKRILVYRKYRPCTKLEDVERLRARLPSSIPVGGGSDANFCELNREHALGNLPVSSLDFVSWSLTPQVHATDDRSFMETVQSLSSMVATAASLSDGKPLIVSPITLRPRFNAVGSCFEPDDEVAIAPADVRQHQPIVAAWMVATWLALGGSGVKSTTWFETHGSRGLFSDSAATVCGPVASAFRIMASTVSVSPVVTSRPNLVAAIVERNAQSRLLAVNLSPEPLHALVRTNGTERDGKCQETRLDIEPYGVSLKFKLT